MVSLFQGGTKVLAAPGVFQHAHVTPPLVVSGPARGSAAGQVDGLAAFSIERRTIHLHPLQAGPPRRFRLPWTHRVVQFAALRSNRRIYCEDMVEVPARPV